jgi:DNA-binding response OmpR family regulator
MGNTMLNSRSTAMPTILLMGDYTHFFHDLVDILELEGFATLVANHDYEGLHLARYYQPNLIVYNHDLAASAANDRTTTFAPQLRKLTARTPVLCLTNAEGCELPDAPYLRKPFAIDDLLGTVKQLLS